MTNKQTIDGVLLRAIEWAFERLEICQDQAFQTCECEQCGKMPDECSGTESAKTCQCRTCDHCSNALLMAELRALLDKQKSEFTVPDCPDCACAQDGQCLCIPSKPDAQPQDTFNGDNKKLVSCIKALLSMDAEGALVPHGIGGHARKMLEASAVRLAAQPQGEPVAMTIPDECPHIIVFDDADREQLVFAGAGARSAAQKTWEQISGSWNAHLFVRIERNSRDDRYPYALSTPLAEEAAKAFAKGFNTLEAGGGKFRINMQFQSREDAWGAFNVLARLKQLNTPQ